MKIFIVLFWVLVPSYVWAQTKTFPPAVQALIPQAEAEGDLQVFGATLNPRQVRAFSQSFNDYYGIDIDLTMSGGLHSAKASEVALAHRAGVPTGIDVFWTGLIAAMAKTGALMEIDWINTYGADPSLAMGPWGLRTHDGHQSMVTVNTGRVTAADAPRTYFDLLDPKWRGRITMPRSPYPWMAMSYALGEDETANLLQQIIAQQEPKLLARYADIRARVLSGEFPVAIGTDIFSLQKRGAPVAHPDIDLLVLSSSGAFVLEDAEHPAAAKLWALWAVSAEGQATLEEARSYSLAETPGTALNTYAKGRRVVHVPFDWRLENHDRLSEKFLAILEGNGAPDEE
ncbi:MAG: ABC transporter substrate-binding protein [Rhodospirillaceae bacterium]